MAKDFVDQARTAADWYLTDTHEETLSLSEVAPVDVCVRRLAVSASSGGKGWFNRLRPSDEEALKSRTILNSIDSDFPRASLSGIIGSSGSGKTTLLNVLSHRVNGKNMSIQGQLLYNDSSSLSSVTHAYVTQTDILLPTLTVRETLMYAADLRLPDSIGRLQRYNLVEEMILELGLKECADTLVGDGFRRKGCSGGERRRLSLGVQLLGNPSVLFLDEPTTGLDATSAYHLVKTLKSLARKGRTIIMTLHQPRSEVFFLLDRLTLLAQGHTLYSGPAAGAITWFEQRLPPPELHVNPANYLIDMAAIDVRTKAAEDADRTRVNMLIAAWSQESVVRFPDIKPEITSGFSPQSHGRGLQPPPFRIIFTLLSRTLKTNFRDPLGMLTSWIEAVLMGLVVGLVFLQLPNSAAGIRSRQAALYISIGLQGYLVSMYEIYRLISNDLPIFDREHGEGVVGVLPWVVSYRIAHFLLEDITVPLIYSVISYYLIGFAPSASRFFYYYAVALLVHHASVMFGGLSASMSRNFAVATLFSNLAFTLHTFVNGFFIQADSIPVYLRWLKWISHLFYGFTALANNEFKDRFFDCPSGDARFNPDCITYRGDFIIRSLGVPRRDWSTIPILAILGFVIFYVLAQISVLHFFTVDITILGRPRQSSSRDTKERLIGATDTSTPAAEMISVDVGLENYSLCIHIRGGKRSEILKGINTCFEAGKVNVILGPSGCGKSSLLNMMAQRLQSSLRATYTMEGELKLNGRPAHTDTLHALCSYVTQDDTALLPYLTVRETLEFAAALRLPNWMSKERKLQKAGEVMKKVGLTGCADTLIGNELLKGISGGEKRRVSIAIQVLTEPRVLMLDEPTSGLDAFTAASIMDLLRQLAGEGRTVITTLHQSSSELFKHFGNVLLMAKGGRVAYSGHASNMLGYMESVGFKCPQTMNPADFALDVVSVDLREAEQEELSRKKVNKLVEEFAHRDQGSRLETRVGGSLDINLKNFEKNMAPIAVSLPILLKRGCLSFVRQSTVAEARLGNVIGVGVGCSLFFSPLGHDYFSIQNRLGCIQEILPIYFVGMLQNVAVYPMERDIFYREYEDGAYSIESFFLAYMLLELPAEIVSCFVFSALAAIATNLSRTIDMFFIIALNSLCMVNAGESLGIIFNTILNDNTGLALNITNILLSVAMFMAGIMSVDMPAFFKGLNKLSPLGYVIRNIMPYAFRGQIFTCDDDQRLSNGSCAISTGKEVLEMFDMDGIDAPLNLGAAVISMVTYRILAYAVIKVAKARFKIQRQRT